MTHQQLKCHVNFPFVRSTCLFSLEKGSIIFFEVITLTTRLMDYFFFHFTLMWLTVKALLILSIFKGNCPVDKTYVYIDTIVTPSSRGCKVMSTK